MRAAQRLTVGDLSPYGLPVPEEGMASRLARLGVAPAIIDKSTVQAIKDRRIEVVAGVERLDGTGVELTDGSRVEPDAVIAATGYRAGLEPIVGHLGLLDERGKPRVRSGEAAPDCTSSATSHAPARSAAWGRRRPLRRMRSPRRARQAAHRTVLDAAWPARGRRRPPPADVRGEQIASRAFQAAGGEVSLRVIRTRLELGGRAARSTP